MKKISFAASSFVLLSMMLILVSCSQQEDFVPKAEEFISSETLEKIARLGFSTEKIIKADFGYVVEGDIVLTEEDINSVPMSYRVPEAEQYHTFNLVRAPRTITVWVADNIDASVVAATEDAIARYNALPLTLTFRMVNKKNADIQVRQALPGSGYLAAAGFPTRNGLPYKYIRVNTDYMNDGANLATMASVMAHEIGHCIGFRHTDWFDRSYSCGRGGSEGEGSIGAEHIPGTPTGPDADSWMLSCIPFSAGVDRPFTNDDKTALDYLYGE